MNKIRTWTIACWRYLTTANLKLLIAVFLMTSTALFGWSLGARADNQLESKVLQIIRDHPEVIIESIQAYQEKQQQAQQQSRKDFFEQLKSNPEQIIGKSPTIGATKLQFVMLEFSDFQCPFCSRASTTIKEFLAKHSQEVTLAYKNLPLASIHDQAIPAAQAAWAAHQQGKFWEYHDALFANQKRLGEDLYLEIAQNLGLNLDQFKRDRTLATNAIDEDLKMAQQLGITGTPFFILYNVTSKEGKGDIFSGAVELERLEEALAKVR